MAETRAAAERLRAITDFGGNVPESAMYGPELGYSRDVDEGLVLDAYLAEHPADEDEPITRAWVVHVFRLTINGAELTDRLFLKQSRKGWGVYVCGWLNEYGEAMDDCLVTKVNTRGQLRRLASALGITLREGASE